MLKYSFKLTDREVPGTPVCTYHAEMYHTADEKGRTTHYFQRYHGHTTPTMKASAKYLQYWFQVNDKARQKELPTETTHISTAEKKQLIVAGK